MEQYYSPTSSTPVQECVGIINDFMMGCLGSSNVELAYDTFVDCAQRWAHARLVDEGFTRQQVLALMEQHEEHENTKIYDAYYGHLTQFNRKVLTAAANSL